ncbi:MAG: hypothetical protein ACREAE_07180 [Nitrosopumilaceae archaeon]
MDSKPKDRTQENDFGHDESEWGFKDKSEDSEWDKNYFERIKKWKFKDDSDVEMI